MTFFPRPPVKARAAVALGVGLALAAGLFPALAPAALAAEPSIPTAALFFTADTNGDARYGLYRAAADGHGPLPVVPERAGLDIGAVTIAPAGDLLAYTVAQDVNGRIGPHRVMVSRLDGSGARVLSAEGRDAVAPSWWGPGRLLWTDATDVRETGTGTVTTLSAPRTGGTATPVPGAAGGYGMQVGRDARTAVMTDFAGADAGLVRVDLATGGRSVIPGTSQAWLPTLSPDGTRIAYLRDSSPALDTDRSEIVVVPVAGGTPAVLADGATVAQHPTWSADGSNVVFDSYAGDAAGDLWSVPADGSRAAAPLTATPAVDEVGPVLTVPDVTAPAPVRIGLITPAGTETALSWSAPAEANWDRIVVRRSEVAGDAPTAPDQGVAVYDGRGTSAVARGLVVSQTYRFSVFAVDRAGNASAASIRTFRALAAPSLTAPRTVVPAGSADSFPASWDSLRATSYDVEWGGWWQDASGAWVARQWEPVVDGAARTIRRETEFGQDDRPLGLVSGSTYQLRVRAVDPQGNATGWVTTSSAVPYDDSSRYVTRSAGWQGMSALANRFEGTLSVAPSAGGTLELRRPAAGFTVVGDLCKGCGDVAIYVRDGDGPWLYKRTVSTEASGTSVRRVLYDGPALAGGVRDRTIKLVTSGGPVRIDGVVARR